MSPSLGSCVEERTMDEKGLLELWNTKRSQIIKAQMAPNLMLIGIFVVAAFGKFETANDGTKYLAIGVAAATGILAIITQYAAIREAELLIIDLKRVEKPSELARRFQSHVIYCHYLPSQLSV